MALPQRPLRVCAVGDGSHRVQVMMLIEGGRRTADKQMAHNDDGIPPT